MELTNIFSGKGPTSLEWAEGGILWDISMYKISGLPIAEQLFTLAQDKDLKKAISSGIDDLLLPHIEKIRNFLLKQGFQAPKMPDRKLKNVNNDAHSVNGLLNDAEIANAMRDVFRLGLELDLRGITYGTRADISYLVKDILNDDIEGYINLIKLSYEKNWILMTPPIQAQSSH